MGDVELAPARPDPDAPRASLTDSTAALFDAGGDAKTRRTRFLSSLADRPHRHCNAAALGAAALALTFAALWLAAPRRPAGVCGVRPGDATFAPEGGLTGSFESARDYRGAPRALTTPGGVVAADHGRCSDVGAAVLARGGNAADAAAAAALCQGVVNPMASGIGGGTIILWRGADGAAETIDGRETAPAAATAALYEAAPANATLDGGLAVGVPLEVMALHALWARHGSGNISWRDVVAPAERLARGGFPAHPYYVSAVSGPLTLKRLQGDPALAAAFLVADPRGRAPPRPPRVGEHCCARPALADTLAAIGATGPSALYADRAARLAADVAAAGGVLTEADVASARARVARPLTARVWGLDLVFPGPPSAAAALAVAAAVAAGYETPVAFGGRGGGAHRLVEAMKQGMALRASLGDPGACGGGLDVGADGGVSGGGGGGGDRRRRRRLAQAPPPSAACFPHTAHVAALLSDAVDPSFADALRASINESRTQAPAAYGGRWGVDSPSASATPAFPPDDHGTSHLVAVDGARNAVSLTTTVNTAFGSGVLSPSTGVLLNNQMDDFSVAGRSNGYGLAAAPANFIAPGKKPLSSMAPVMLASPTTGALRAVAGASGGPRILTAVLTTLVRLVEEGAPPLAAVAGPRLHSQVLPDAVYAEDWTAGALTERVPAAVLAGLRARGHDVKLAGWGGVAQAAVVAEDGGSVEAASDPRKDGAPAAAA